MKILIRAPNWIGDAIMAVPAIQNLSHNYPDADISVLAKEWVKDLLSSYDFIHQIIPLPDRSNLAEIHKAVKTIKQQEFDAGLLLTNSFGSALLFSFAHIPERWGYNRDGRGALLTKKTPVPAKNKKLHQVNYYLQLLASLGLKVEPAELFIPLKEIWTQEAEKQLHSAGINFAKPLVFLNPGAYYGAAKQWPARRFAELAQLLQKQNNADIAIIGSRQERPLADEIASNLPRPPLILTGTTTLQQLAAFIHHASLFVTNDSGPMHIANALHVPVVAVFGPTDYRITAPFQQPSVVVRKPSPCWPCSYRVCPYDHRCMLSIQPEEVYQACQGYL